MAEPSPTYTREEMDAILKRAIERQQAKSEEIGHEDLIAAAGEVGIPREDVEAAARDLEREKANKAGSARPLLTSGVDRAARRADSRSAPLGPPDEARARAVRGLLQRVMTYFGLSLFFFFIGRETGTGWWIWPVFGMGMSLVVQSSRVFFGDPDGREERRLSRRERQRMHREQRLADFERKVAIGAEALVRVIDEARNARTRTGPRVVVTPPPGVRVEAREGEEVERESEGGSEGARRNLGRE